jgi:hypothetical protein
VYYLIEKIYSQLIESNRVLTRWKDSVLAYWKDRVSTHWKDRVLTRWKDSVLAYWKDINLSHWKDRSCQYNYMKKISLSHVVSPQWLKMSHNSLKR